MTQIAIGSAVEDRYKALGLTQDTLAWAAGVSSSTVRNVLASRVGRTWPRVARALGWARDSAVQMRDGEQPTEIVPLDALRPLLAAALRLREKRDARADAVLEFCEDLVANAELVETEEVIVKGGEREIRRLINKYWPMVKSQLSPDEAEPLIEYFRDFGWRDVRGGSGVITTHAELSATGQKVASGSGELEAETDLPAPAPEGPVVRIYDQYVSTSKLPLSIETLLEDGAVRDHAVFSAPEDSLKMAVVTIVDQDQQQPTTRDRHWWLQMLRVIDESSREV